MNVVGVRLSTIAECLAQSSTMTKCANCQSDHPASSPTCPVRRALLARLKNPQMQRPTLPLQVDFPPLRNATPPTLPSGGDSSLCELLQMLQDPNLRRFFHMVLRFLQKLSQRPTLLSNLQQLMALISA